MMLHGNKTLMKREIRRKNIIINGAFLIADHPVGLHRFSNEIIKRLDKKHNNNIKIAVPCKDRINGYRPNNIEIIECFPELIRAGNFGVKLWQYLVYPFVVIKNNGYTFEFSFAQQLFKCDVCSILDCIIFNFSQNDMTLKAQMMRFLDKIKIRISARKSKYIITLSEDAKKDIIKYTGISENKIIIVPCGWEHIKEITYDDTIFERLPKEIKKGRYFFSLGSRYKHKNIKWIIKAAEQNKSDYFVVTGFNFQKENDVEEKYPPNVLFTGYLTDSEIKSLMKECRAFIQPSLYEGFGIPPMEALGVGSQIIVSRTSCLPEIYQGAAHYIDPYDYQNINMEKILSSKVSDGKEVLDKYSWEQAADQIFMLMQNLIRYA